MVLISYENYKEFILIVEATDGSLKENIQVIINIIELPPLSIEAFSNDKVKIFPKILFNDAEKWIKVAILYRFKNRAK